jgi:NAD(P)-dependent dehydrogenase (short-subunit alcohol dehydrogenase family)
VTHPPKTAFVTGGGSGIGLAIVRALADRDWQVAVCGRDLTKLDRAVASLSPARVMITPADVSREDDVARWVDAARRRFGSPDVLVNNAGVYEEAEIAALPTEQWDRVVGTNLRGTFLCTRAVLPLMQTRGGGYVINIASISGKRGLAGMGAYTASKFGVMGLTDCLRHEGAAHHIRATAICPGWVATPMAVDSGIPDADMVQPEDVARTVAYLLDLNPHVVVPEIVLDRIGPV